jgi:hypothetical protein
MPLAYPAVHTHWYACAEIDDAFIVESAHAALFLHGLLLHSFTSRSQLPLHGALEVLSSLSITRHSAVYSLIKAYAHAPLAKPATHAHRYAWIDTADFDVESLHVAPFLHGLLLHSSTSMSQLPLSVALALLSFTPHSELYCATNGYLHTPLAKPFAHAHWYAWIDTADAYLVRAPPSTVDPTL